MPDRRIRAAQAVLVGYWLLLFVATHVPRPPDLPHVEGGDKVAHAVAYAGLALLWAFYRSLRASAARVRYGWIFVVLAAYAVVDELLQIPVGRKCDFWDWVADVGGAAAGLACFALALPLGRRLFSSGRK